MKIISNSADLALPILIGGIILFGLFQLKSRIFSTFLEGAKSGIKTAINILPSLIGLVCAVELFKASGALDILTTAAKPLTNSLHIPSEILPLLILRPISGSGTIALLDNILSTLGPDSLSGRMASVICASGETTLYASTLYFGSVGIKNIRHTLIAAFAADFCGILVSAVTVNLFFG